MDIFNRPPAIAEDTLQFAIYPPPNLSDRASVTSFAACFSSFLSPLLQDFIWHRDAIEFKVVANPDLDGHMLECRMRVGDCVDDEWCVVWLLKEISSKWDVVISVFDSDGEFLLIEAAEGLPSWVKPSNSENRVWIYNTRLHLIPLSHISPPSRKRHHRKLPGITDSDEDGTFDEEHFIGPDDAIKLVRDDSVDTFAPHTVEKLVWDRISGYPDAIKQHVHTTKAFIPIDVAKVIAVNPYLVQKAVETFYTRDAIQLRAAHRMSRFPTDSILLSSVKMTRTAYAQLLGQKFFPPKIFGRWQEKEGTDEWKWRDVGMKIAVGFEMLYQESKGRTNSSSLTPEGILYSAEAAKDALRRDPEYQKYIQNLVSADYFQGEAEGSQLWNTLENQAATTFIEARRTDDATRVSFASQVDAALSRASDTLLFADRGEDNDEWLNIDSQGFDNILQQKLGKSRGFKSSQDSHSVAVDEEVSAEDRLAAEQSSRLKDLAAKVENFVEGEGDLEGALFEDEEMSDEEFSDSESADSEDEVDAAIAEAKQTAMDNLVPKLDPTDFGKMPASYYTNSQRVAPNNIETEVIADVQPQESGTFVNESEPQVKAIRQPILPRDDFDGVDSDDESDEEASAEDDESEEDRPQMIGDIEIDMEEEEGEFLDFAREALGITDEHWNEIVKDRRDRGAFVPASANLKPKITSAKPTAQSNSREELRRPAAGLRPDVNPNLDSFEAVMRAMDAELAKSRLSNTQKAQLPRESAGQDRKGKGKGKDKAFVMDEAEDIEAAMDAELKAALERDGDGDEDGSDEEPMDYNLIKNFLESFKSQGGLSGPVSNLAGRLQPDFKLPRDYND